MMNAERDLNKANIVLEEILDSNPREFNKSPRGSITCPLFRFLLLLNQLIVMRIESLDTNEFKKKTNETERKRTCQLTRCEYIFNGLNH